MIRTLTATADSGASLNLDVSLGRPAGYILTSVTGLGQADAQVTFRERTGSYGRTAVGSRLAGRDIGLTIRILDGPNAQNIRSDIYKAFPAGRETTLAFDTDLGLWKARVIVEKCEANVFTNEASVTITTRALDPWLFSDDCVVNELMSNSNGAFEFPFPIRNSTPGFIVSERVQIDSFTINNDGTLEVEPRYEVVIGTPTNAIRIGNLKITREFQEGDLITIETQSGKRRIELVRTAGTENLLKFSNGVRETWPTVPPGANEIAVEPLSSIARFSAVWQNRIGGL